MTSSPVRSATSLSDQIAEEIRAQLGRQRMSQRGLALKLGVSPAWINFRLTGVQEIGLNDLQRIAAALGVDPLDLFPRIGTSNARSRSLRPPADAHLLDAPASRPIGPKPGGSTRPQSPVPPTRRRPVSTRPGNRPMAA